MQNAENMLKSQLYYTGTYMMRCRLETPHISQWKKKMRSLFLVITVMITQGHLV